MGSLLSILGSSAFGSLFGSIFAYLGKREERAVMAEKNKHEQAMLGLQNQQAIALADKNMQAAQVAGQVLVAGKEADAFVESQRNGRVIAGTSTVVQILTSAVRPFVTVYLLAIATYQCVQISRLAGGLAALDTASVLALYTGIIEQVFFLTNLCVSWWFGARGSSVRGLKN